jgi:hypothetical protein
MDFPRLSLPNLRDTQISDSYESFSSPTPNPSEYELDSIDLSMHPHATQQSILEYLNNNPTPHNCTRIRLEACRHADDKVLEIIASKYSHLKKFHLDSNFLITDQGIRTLLQSCTQLESLSIVRCPALVDPFSGIKSKHVALKHLQIRWSWWLNPEAATSIAIAAPNITKLTLKELSVIYKLEDSVIGLIKTYKNLTSLNLSLHRITNITITAIGQHLKSLKYLKLDECNPINSDALITLSKGCSQLKYLSLVGNEQAITDTLLEALKSHCVHLEHIRVDLETNLIIKAQTLVNLSQKCTKLKQMPFACSSTLNDKNFQEIVSHATNLEKLSLYAHEQFTDAYLQTAADRLPNLRALEIVECHSFLGYSLLTMAKKCPNLVHLGFSNCEVLDPARLIHMLKELPKLKTFYFNASYQATDDLLHTLSKSCPKLKKLNLEGCQRITDKGLIAIASNLLNLEFLNIKSCTLVTLKGLRAIAQNCSKLYDLSMAISIFQNIRSFDITSQVTAFIPFPSLRTLEIEDSQRVNLVKPPLSSVYTHTRRNISTFIKGCSHLRELFIHNCAFMENKDFQDALVENHVIKSIIIGDHPFNKAHTILEDLRAFIESKHHLMQLSVNGLERINEYH